MKPPYQVFSISSVSKIESLMLSRGTTYTFSTIGYPNNWAISLCLVYIHTCNSLCLTYRLQSVEGLRDQNVCARDDDASSQRASGLGVFAVRYLPFIFCEPCCQSVCPAGTVVTHPPRRMLTLPCRSASKRPPLLLVDEEPLYSGEALLASP